MTIRRDDVDAKHDRPELNRGNGRTFTALAFAAAIPLLLLSGWVATLMAQQQRDLTRGAAVASATRVAERVASDIAAQIGVLEAEAASATLDKPDLAAFYAEAERLKRARPLWETVELARPDGVQIVNLLRSLDDELGPTADRRSFDAVVGTHRPVVGGIGPVGPVSGKRLVALRVPVIRGGELRYVLSVGLANDAVSSILRDAGASDGWVGTIVDADGNTIARTRAEAEELGQPADAALRTAIRHAPNGFYTGSTLEGSNVEVVYRTLKDTGGWSVHFGMPAATLNAPVLRSYLVLGGGSVVSIGLALALVGLVGRDMAQRRSGERARFALALRSSEEQGAVATEAAELGTLRWDTVRGKVTGSPRAAQLLGWRADVAEDGETAADAGWVIGMVHPDDRARLSDDLHWSLADGGAFDVEFRVDGRWPEPRWVRLVGRAPRLRDAASAGLVYGVVSDIEPRKRAEAERLELLRRLGEAQENEQRRIARELHDQVGQTVTGLSLGLKSLERLLDVGGAIPEAGRQVQWLQTLAGEIGRDIHRAAVDLRPTALDDLGLHEALATLLREWGQRHGVRADLEFLGEPVRLPAAAEGAIYRIVQEALTNVLKHAKADTVSVSVEHRPQEVRVIVEDDGDGFDPEAVSRPAVDGSPAKPRLGLSGIRERLSLLDGTLTLETSPGVGTTLFIRIPVPQAACA
ncbi:MULTISPECIES: ATP-binding protein [unclassified Methylobacterium]|uniref:ATP-binding protein n=1 Tax=unclassified Methylobacterium TaxID=2615210 RepID=UPI0011C1D8B0|nr:MULTISPECIES: ATP-binding protein [unclassified Methylobacterium]QEE39172.1 histidine kinase [Methylobacterium sp. WL1]TXN56038.1 histidine kinase [Methylobacterium sp. WL2]